MPTGYTSIIEEGCTFQEYAIRCAKAFGACVTLRDDPLDKPIPEKFEPSDWNKKRLAESEARMKELAGMGLKAAGIFAAKEYEAAEKSRLESLARAKLIQGRYEAMRKQVLAWTSPSPDHDEYRKFMLDQIDLCTRTSTLDYYEKPTERLSADAWLVEQKKKTQRDIDYHRREHHAELERVDGRNRWIRQLRESLR